MEPAKTTNAAMKFEIPKTEWDDGPWQHEPDLLRWIDNTTGLRCLILRSPVGGLCGYVGVRPDHPAYELDGSGEPADVVSARTARFRKRMEKWDPAEGLENFPMDPEPHVRVPGVGDALYGIRCHGGLTWAGRLTIPDQRSSIEGDIWWFGFDCAHAGDLVPGVDAALRLANCPPRPPGILPPDIYRNVAYVRNEVLSLAKQLKALEVEVPEWSTSAS